VLEAVLTTRFAICTRAPSHSMSCTTPLSLLTATRTTGISFDDGWVMAVTRGARL
jgi:hypothetical protein